MGAHWLHWKAKSSLCALAVSNVRFNWWHFFISSYELTVSNELSLTARFTWWHFFISSYELTVSNELWLTVRFTWWHFFISSYELTVSNELSLTTLKSKEFTLWSGSFKHKIHLVTFLYIFLLVDCFKWALIDCIEKRRVHSVLWQFQM